MNQITIYFFNNPLYSNISQSFQIGYIDPTSSPSGSLIDITALANITIIDSPECSVDNRGSPGYILVQSTAQNTTACLQISYNGISQIFSNCFIQPLPVVTTDNLYNNFINYLPKNVYTTAKNNSSAVYCDNLATSTLLEQIYNNSELDTLLDSTQQVAFTDLQTIINSFFPDSGNSQWEYALVGTNTLYNKSFDYHSLLTLLYQTNTNNDTNPYFLALNISKYIYYRLGESYYVLVGENNVDVLNAFILDLNQLSRTLFNNGNNFPDVGPQTIVIFIVNGNTLSSEFQKELYVFIRRIVSPYFLLKVEYNYNLSQLGLTVYLGDTYWKDSRQLNIACIQYNKNVLAEALGYTTTNSDTGLISITDYSITLTPTPPFPNVLSLGQTYLVTINTTPTITLTQPIVYYTEFFCSDQSILTTQFDGTNENFIAKSTGTVQVKIYLGVAGTEIPEPINPLLITYTIT